MRDDELVAELRRVAPQAMFTIVGPSPVCDERVCITLLLSSAADVIQAGLPIPVSERLPTDDEDYSEMSMFLGYGVHPIDGDGSWFEVVFSLKESLWYYAGMPVKITHWLPLPPTPV